MKAQDTWTADLKPLLDEYVYALRAAEDARKGFGWLDHLEEVAHDAIDWMAVRQIAGALPTQWDRHTKRAAALADTLLLTPDARRRNGIGDSEEQDDPLARFATPTDELAPRRRKTA